MGTEAAMLSGACTCGRNQYEILPITPSSAQVLFDDTLESQRSHGALIPAFLRVPLATLRSTTYAFYPNETHTDIRRAFTPRHTPHSKRHFCGFCGTPLSSWSEADRAEAEWVRVNLGSLETQSLALLNDLGILPDSDEEEEHAEEGQKSRSLQLGNQGDSQDEPMAVAHDGSTRIKPPTGPGNEQVRMGKPWVENIIEGSRLGKMRRRRGGNTSLDGTVKVEWEILEFDGDDTAGSDDNNTNGKRKIGEVAGDLDIEARH